MAKTDLAGSARQIPAIKVHQWPAEWNLVLFDENEHRRKPEPHFYIFSIPAVELRSLCGISRRKTDGLTPRAADMGIQRAHDEERSKEISRFVQFGYPWSTLSEAKRESSEFHDLRKPGWLPTSIVVNILPKGARRDGDKEIDDADLIHVIDENGICRIGLPYQKWMPDWEPSSIPPLEVIDGQHRLWSFDPKIDSTQFQVPVVAFHGLDTSWQAYLFWTINIKPKKINASLAFDLYPLLRTEDWLERAEQHAIYRETRSQELTEILWSHPESPWYDAINMLGERGNRWVTQNAWIRTLTSTLVRAWDGRGAKLGGLFGSRLGKGEEVLGWSRSQQAAFLVYAWRQLRSEIQNSKKHWAEALREKSDGEIR